ncbi:hypothetical protein B0H11DRAFT_2288447 [Mycena galericulata]|nr:hypothetical protein B0H11DRAFT_2288447 [Mycena galericulata]
MTRIARAIVLISILAYAGATPIVVPGDSNQMHFDMPVFTVTREYKTTTDVPPYIITQTTTMTWTQSSSTTVAFPTGPGN